MKVGDLVRVRSTWGKYWIDDQKEYSFDISGMFGIYMGVYSQRKESYSRVCLESFGILLIQSVWLELIHVE